MKFQNKRGGRIVLKDIQKPLKDEWGTPLEAMQAALELEKAINSSLLELHASATKHDDSVMTDYIEGIFSIFKKLNFSSDLLIYFFVFEEFLQEQVESIKQISDYITTLKRVGPGLGEYIFDKETLENAA